MLNAVDCSVTKNKKKPSQIETSGRYNTKVYYGDGLKVDVLRRADAATYQCKQAVKNMMGPAV